MAADTPEPKPGRVRISVSIPQDLYDKILELQGRDYPETRLSLNAWINDKLALVVAIYQMSERMGIKPDTTIEEIRKNLKGSK